VRRPRGGGRLGGGVERRQDSSRVLRGAPAAAARATAAALRAVALVPTAIWPGSHWAGQAYAAAPASGAVRSAAPLDARVQPVVLHPAGVARTAAQQRRPRDGVARVRAGPAGRRLALRAGFDQVSREVRPGPGHAHIQFGLAAVQVAERRLDGANRIVQQPAVVRRRGAVWGAPRAAVRHTRGRTLRQW